MNDEQREDSTTETAATATAERDAGLVQNEGSGVAAGSPGETGGRTIRIGTQRPGSPAIKARPRPLSSVVRKAVARHEQGSEESSSVSAPSSAVAQVSTAQFSPSQGSPTQNSPPSPVADNVAGSPAGDKPTRGDHSAQRTAEIEDWSADLAREDAQAPAAAGSETRAERERSPSRAERGPSRSGRGQPPLRELPQPSAPRVQVPSIRDAMTPEEEQELDAAMADASLQEAAAPPPAPPAPPPGPEAPDAPRAAVEPGVELEPGGRYQGVIVAIRNDDVFVELGQRQQGIVPLRQFEETPPEVGQPVEVTAVGYDRDDNLYHFSRPGAPINVADWSQVQEGTVVEATIIGCNKGGLECQVNTLRGFIPAGQASLYHVPDLSTLIGERFACLVLEANPQRRNFVLSRRAIMEREQGEARKKLLEEIKEGQVRDGIVRKVMDFGAFVDLGGIDGLLHVSKLSWERVHHPRDILNEGDTIKVQVERIDWDKKRISLSMRDLQENPWSQVAQKYPLHARVQGRVTRIMDFGAFVELEPGMEGLVHISQLSHSRVWRVSDVVTEGDIIEAEVMSIDPEKRRIALSMKALEARPVTQKEPRAEDMADDTGPSDHDSRNRDPGDLKGGLRRGGGGDQFGLKW